MKTRKINKIALLDVPFNIAGFIYCIYSFRTAVQQSGFQEMIDRDDGELFTMVAALILLAGAVIFDLLCLLSDKDKQGFNKAVVIMSFVLKILVVAGMIVLRLVG